MTDHKPVKVTRDGVTMTVTSKEAADQLATAGWKPVTNRRTTTK